MYVFLLGWRQLDPGDCNEGQSQSGHGQETINATPPQKKTYFFLQKKSCFNSKFFNLLLYFYYYDAVYSEMVNVTKQKKYIKIKILLNIFCHSFPIKLPILFKCF